MSLDIFLKKCNLKIKRMYNYLFSYLILFEIGIFSGPFFKEIIIEEKEFLMQGHMHMLYISCHLLKPEARNG